jgi:hypothetical protein
MEQADEMHRVKMDVELKKLANFSSQTSDTAADRLNKGMSLAQGLVVVFRGCNCA